MRWNAGMPARTLFLLVCSGCGTGFDSESSPSVRDSADVTIIENGPDVADPRWDRIQLVPDLEIGAGNASDVLFGRIVDLTVDDGGRIYVLDQLEGVIRVFQADGEPLHTMGREGAGPGEFSRFVNGILLRRDTLLVADWGNQRLTRFTASGTLSGSGPLPAAPGSRSWWLGGPDGALRGRVLRRVVEDDGRWGGEDVVIRVPGIEADVDTLFAFDYTPTDIGGRGAIRAALIINTPAWAVLDDASIAWTALDLAELRVHAPDGRRARIIRRDAWVSRPATPGDRARLIDLLGDRLERLGGSRATLAILDIPPLDALPVLTAVVAGPNGTIWVQRAGEPAAFHPMSINAPEFPQGLGGDTWDIFDGSGRFLTTISLPGIQVVRIDDRVLYGIRRDDLGVETVVRMRIEGVPPR